MWEVIYQRGAKTEHPSDTLATLGRLLSAPDRGRQGGVVATVDCAGSD